MKKIRRPKYKNALKNVVSDGHDLAFRIALIAELYKKPVDVVAADAAALVQAMVSK